MLIVLSGRAGTGKTTIARALAREAGAVHVRVDTIEQALRNAGRTVDVDGYLVAYGVAEDNLRAGRLVVADSVNPCDITRDAWRSVALRAGTAVIEVEVVCSVEAEHRRRVETRLPDMPAHRLPTWQEVIDRDYQPWITDRLVIDTASATVEEIVQAIVAQLGRVTQRATKTRQPQSAQRY